MLMVFPPPDRSAPYGIDFGRLHQAASSAQRWVIPALMQLISIIGWNSLLLIFFAEIPPRSC